MMVELTCTVVDIVVVCFCFMVLKLAGRSFIAHWCCKNAKDVISAEQNCNKMCTNATHNNTKASFILHSHGAV